MSGSNAVTAMTDVCPNVVASPVRWGAVYAMALSSFVLVTSEFMPVSLLSPIGRSLTLSDGQVGHAIAVSAAFALVTSFLVGSLFGRLDRRTVLLGLTTLLIVSGTVVPFAPNYTVMMVGRALLGVAIGGFWSMSAAIAMRLVPSPDVPKALAVINGGNALASVLAALLGSFMEGMLGWRGTFLCILPVSAVAVLWLASSLPSLPARAGRDGDGVLRLLRRRPLVVGLGTVSLFFMGQFSLFTYLRPFLEKVTGIGVPTLSIMLLLVIALLLVANVVVALANDHQALMVGRALLGVVVGGFWSMSAAIAMRLVPSADVPKALAIVNGGIALAFAMIGPLGSYMGDLIGWRGTFLGMVPLVALAVLWQFLALKPLRVDERPSKGAIIRLLRDPLLVSDMVAVGLFYAGQFSLFTYLRPFLEQVSGITGSLLSVMLLVVGVSGLAGAAVVGRLLDDRRLYLIMGGLASLMAVTAVALALFGTDVAVVAVLLAVWGFTGTAAPAAWWTWLARSAPDDAEAGGGLLVAVMQAAIALGAAGGGIVFDRYGAATQFLCSAALLALTAVTVAGLVHLRSRSRRCEAIQHEPGV